MTETPETPAPQSQAPICPHCLADPFDPQAVPFNTDNGVVLLIFFCGGCRKVINAVILQMPQPRVQGPPRSPIIMPGRPQ